MGSSQNGKSAVKPGSPPPKPYLVLVSQRFIVLALLSSILVAFAVGRTSRILLLDIPQRALLERQRILLAKAGSEKSKSGRNLPTPVIPLGKVVPRTSYTSKNFDTALSSSIDSRWVLAEEQNADSAAECLDASSKKAGSDHDDEAHFPAGQHLLIDIENVEMQFLNSMERLANAMIELVNECGLTLLSYHCHMLEPVGVSCVGVLLESHVSFHTWPWEGVITLDLFTCGPNSLLPVVGLAQSLFAVPESLSETGKPVKEPYVIWAHKLRGYREDQDKGGYQKDIDITSLAMVGARNDYKKQIVTTQTPFQRVDIWDVLKPQTDSFEAYAKSLSGDGSYESRNPQFFEADRIVFLDGVLQSQRSGDAAYHEALVHPAMFAHDNPKRVAIIGGGEGATLREVLKHNTIEKVVMIEIDEMMVKISREHLPEWNDCSNIEGSSENCFDDPRTEMHYVDAFAWFTDRFINKESNVDEEPFDVIIIDALDPQIEKDFLDALYAEGPFLRSLPIALTTEGVVVIQVGEAPWQDSASEVYSHQKNRARLINSLVSVGFEVTQDYEESHCQFDAPWQLLVAAKSRKTKDKWSTNEAEVNLEMRKRVMPTVDGESPFRYFDGGTMLGYRYPSKLTEVVFCRRDPQPDGCQGGHGYDLDRQNIPISSLEVKSSGVGNNMGVFSTINIPASSYIGLEKLVHAVRVEPATYSHVLQWEKHFSNKYAANVIKAYLHSYGSSMGSHGELEVFADASTHCFVNHGCKGANNVGRFLSVTEETASKDALAAELVVGRDDIYNPAKERQTHFYSRAIPLRDILQGEELLENFLGRSGDYLGGWRARVTRLEEDCSGGGGGQESK